MDAIEWHAYYNCAWCHALRPKTEIVKYEGIPFCRDNPECMEKFHERTHPRPRRIDVHDDGHC